LKIPPKDGMIHKRSSPSTRSSKDQWRI